MPLKTRAEEPMALNLTPMVDVVFTLIIFFMVGAKFTDEQRELDLKLPTVANAAVAEGAPRTRTIVVAADGRLELDGAIVTVEELIRDLRAADGKATNRVMIKGDASVPFQRVAAVLSASREAGIREMAIAVKLGPTQR